MTGTAELTQPATSPTEGQPATTTSITAPPSSQPDPKAQTATTAAPATGESKSFETKGETTTGKPQGAPEKYEDFKAPEGLTYDPAIAASWSAVAKALNLPQGDAEKHLATLAQAVQAASIARAEAARNEWKESAQKDKEFGGDAKTLAANLSVAQKAFSKFATPELTKLLNETRLGDHPEVIRWFYRAGKALSVDDIVTGTPPSAGPKSDADLFFGPNQKK